MAIKELFRDVRADLNRMDKDTFFPQWLRAAEYRINNVLRDRRMVTRAILPITETTFPVPEDFLEAESMSIQSAAFGNVPGEKRGTLQYVPTEMVDDDVDTWRPFYNSQHPRFFTTHGRFIELVRWQAPAEINFQIQLYYFAELPKLNPEVETSTNWFLDKAPHIYKNAMLHFGFLHLEEPETARNYLEMAAGEIEAINAISENMKHGTGPLIMRRPATRMGGRHS